MIFIFNLINWLTLDKLAFISLGLCLIAGIFLLPAYLRRKDFHLHSASEYNILQQIMDQVNIATWSFDPYHGNYFFSNSIEKICGWPAQYLISKPELWAKLVHPYDSLLVREANKDLLAGRKSMLEFRIMLADGKVKWIQRLGIPVKDQSGKLIRITGLIIDISEQKQMEENMKQMAYYDALTGLANRSMFEYYFTHCQASSRHFNQSLAIIFIDLDSFKKVNDELGHNAGDILLKLVATRLKYLLRGNDLLSRLGGDEFVVLLTRVSHESLIAVAERIIGTFAETFEVEGHHLTIGASLGISICPDDGEDLESLMHNADQAMYQAKKRGKNNYVFYS